MTRLLAVFLLLSVHGAGLADDFTRKLPDLKYTNSLTSEKLKNIDAVIILKEQSYNSTPKLYMYGGLDVSGLATVHAKVLIVKLLTEAGVKRYGSFEYEFNERFGKDFKSGFEARARVMKPDGTLWVMPEENVSIIVTRENSNGIPLARKALFKIPDLAAGDVLQIEYAHDEPFTYSGSGIFFYDERDPVLYSNLYITLPANELATFISLPANRIGDPKIDQVSTTYGSGKTYFWSLKNLTNIPDEPYSRTLQDQAMLTAFTLEHYEPSGMHQPMSWDLLAREYNKYDLEGDDIRDASIKQLGLSPTEANVTMEKVDELYAAIRKNIYLNRYNSVYPLSDNISSIFEKKKGDASDLSYIMLGILKKWKQNAQGVLIRDKRTGVYETSIPTIVWFDRLGVLVTINGKERLYDFDRCIPTSYEQPWYLRDIDVVAVDKELASHKKVGVTASLENTTSSEIHRISLGGTARAKDSLTLSYKGARAQRLRSAWYDLEAPDLNKEAVSLVSDNALSEVDTVMVNKFLDEPEVCLHAVGTPAAVITRIDSVITIRPKNQLLRAFHQKLYSTARYGPVILDEPFKLKMEWNIVIPPGYIMTHSPGDKSSSGVARTRYSVRYTSDKNACRVSAEGTFPEMIIDLRDYLQLISFVDKFTEAAEKEIVFRKGK